MPLAVPGATVPPGAPFTLTPAAPNNQHRFGRGQPITLSVQPSRDAHVYCYQQDETAKITRYYPNRFSKDSFVGAAKPLAVPGTMRFALAMNAKGLPETILCLATPRDVLAGLPRTVVGTDFEPLQAANLDQIRAAFVAVSGSALAQETFHVQAK